MTTPASHASRLTLWAKGGPISYLHAGPADGSLVVLVHGWPATAMTWLPQIDALAANGYRVVAPDMRGYGQSACPGASSAYALRHLVDDLRSLLTALGRKSAVWVGHDWGAAVVSALAAHHPGLCDGVGALVVPYRTLDRGLTAMLDYVNRTVYPAQRYPFAQFDYMAFYEQAPHRVTAQFDSAPDRLVRAIYRRGDPAILSAQSPRAYVTRDGGWFGGAATLPDLPRDTTLLPDAIYDDLVGALSANGFWGPTSYYLNHEDNRRYSDESVNNGYLAMPTLFVAAQFDPTTDIDRSRLAEPMRQYSTDFTEVSIEAGHWVGLEKPEAVNSELVRWLHIVAARRDDY